MTRLSFTIQTTTYLGTRETGQFCVELLHAKLPRKFWPTKYQDYTWKKKPLSFSDQQPLLDCFPSSFPNYGFVTLYKVRGLFDFFVSWRKNTPERLAKTPGLKFCTIGLSFDNAENFIADPALMDPIREIWLMLCQHFNALYGYGEYGLIDMEKDGKGMGRCLPRLHWLTYLGDPYVKVFGLDASSSIPNCNLTHLSTGALLELHGDPLDLLYPNEKEKQIIQQLGNEYFWNFVTPSYPYKMPEIDLSQVILSS